MRLLNLIRVKNRINPLNIHHKQSGVVLFFALIALVAMSLAAVALIRSVDTNSLIVGNLSFKQSSMISADRGVEAAIDWLQPKPVVDMNLDDLPKGYYATSRLNPRTIFENNPADVVTLAQDAHGNTVSYVVQRMCNKQGAPDTSICITSAEQDVGSCKDDPQCPKTFRVSLMYRVTARVVGPKNTESFVQAFVY